MQCILLVTFGTIRSENNFCIKLIEMVVKTVNQLNNFDFSCIQYIRQSVNYNTIGSCLRKSLLRLV